MLSTSTRKMRDQLCIMCFYRAKMLMQIEVKDFGKCSFIKRSSRCRDFSICMPHVKGLMDVNGSIDCLECFKKRFIYLYGMGEK